MEGRERREEGGAEMRCRCGGYDTNTHLSTMVSIEGGSL